MPYFTLREAGGAPLFHIRETLLFLRREVGGVLFIKDKEGVLFHNHM